MEIFVVFGFEAAHRIPTVAPEHLCARLHGHWYRVRVDVDGPVADDAGWLMDFADVKSIVEPVRLELDHRLLNDLEGLDNPTAEHIAVWLWARLVPDLPLLAAIEVRETPNAGCIYRGR
jgi:6-pyruvoyltetrahydropterin/6-carboxytetrahydropterin synthase